MSVDAGLRDHATSLYDRFTSIEDLPLDGGSRSPARDSCRDTFQTVSVIASGGKRYYWPKVLRKASVLPITFPSCGGRVGGGCGGSESGGLYSVVGGVRGNVGGCGGAPLYSTTVPQALPQPLREPFMDRRQPRRSGLAF